MDPNELQQIQRLEESAKKPRQILCCTASGCIACGAHATKEGLEKAVAISGSADHTSVVGVGCLGLCSQGPLVRVGVDGPMYAKVDAGLAGEIVNSLDHDHCSATQVDTGQPFFTRQMPIVLKNVGKIDPERIESSIAAGGYQALRHVLFELIPAQVVDEVTRSGLRGRGGAGYPTGLKWATVAKTQAGQRYVVCNADEGDPGAFMDRSVLEGDPHAVLEGMAIAGYAVGADQGYIYIRGEYPLATRRLQIAIEQARRLGTLGVQIFGTGFDFRIDIRTGAGAYVCGEETALLASIEGKRGLPRPRPPYPAQSGLWGCPTLINNVETFANIAPIIKNGADWYASIGTPGSKGTKVFSLSGKVMNVGLVEVPMGTTLRTIVEEIGGGAPDGSVIKAVQTGGPAGGCIPAEYLDTPVDYESLTKLGSMMGSGGMVVMDSRDDMVEIARFFMEFCMDESCGKCIPCRAGTVQMYRLLTKIVEGRAGPDDLETLRSLCDLVKNASLCGLGQGAPNPVLSTLQYFEKEYTSKLRPGRSIELPVISGDGHRPVQNALSATAAKEVSHGS